SFGQITIVFIANVVVLAIIASVLLFSVKIARQKIKDWLDAVTFSGTVRDIPDGPSAEVIPQWDLDREVKHRVWQDF
uniref:Uncharacterized protein n=1 Tax=Globisporangium ultimum (strain ATCC 200006 / CBS 805.95 / DAOM BR144) TaxID=431595 RepID=K3X6Q5_GLOUD